MGTLLVTCVVCGTRPRITGLLCETCEQELPAPSGLLPSQISTTSEQRGRVALIDPWGRPHHVDGTTLIGRAGEAVTLQILDASISRSHARFHHQADGSWSLRDLGSQNGTFVNDQPVNELPVRHGDRIGLGPVDFFFVIAREELAPVSGEPLVKTAVNPRRTTPRAITGTGGDEAVPRLVDLRVVSPSGGGGGILEIDGIELKLTAIQLDLILLLAQRMIDEAEQPWQVRGFVRSSELLGHLPWDTHNPDDNHVKQLIRRVRRSLIRAGIGDLFESRHRFGYRFKIVPRLQRG